MLQYIGNKQSLVDSIYHIIKKYNIEGNTFCDLFAGTHSVGNYFKSKGYTIIANDWQGYSYVIGKFLIENNSVPTFDKLLNSEIGIKINTIKNDSLLELSPYEKIINYLNSLEGEEGFFYNNYCPGGTKDQEHQRMYFSDENGKKFDKIRTTIQKWKDTYLINEYEFYILLATAIKALDSVSNTTSVYGAFLKHMKGQAVKELTLKPLELNINGKDHKVYQKDANELVREINVDILYLDPPYNTRQYASNYHVLETAALYDNPTLYGKTGLRDYEHQKSPYSSKAKVKNALDDLIQNSNAKYILLSYNDEGILSDKDIKEVFGKKGEVFKEEIEYKRFRSDKDSENRQYKRKDNTVKELVYILKVNQ